MQTACCQRRHSIPARVNWVHREGISEGRAAQGATGLHLDLGRAGGAPRDDRREGQSKNTACGVAKKKKNENDKPADRDGVWDCRLRMRSNAGFRRAPRVLVAAAAKMRKMLSAGVWTGNDFLPPKFYKARISTNPTSVDGVSHVASENVMPLHFRS